MHYFQNPSIKKIILALFLLCISSFCLAQNQRKKDSLYKIIRTEKIDTIKLLGAYNSYGKELYLEAKLDSALILWDKAYSNFSKTFTKQSDTSFINHKSSLLNNLGVVNQQKGNLSAALYFQYESLKLREKNGTQKEIATTLSNIGVINRMLKNYEKSISAYVRSYNILKKIDDKYSTGYILSNLGVVYNELKNYNLAKFYFKESIKIREEIKDSTGLGQSFSNISSLYIDASSFDSANYFLQKALLIEPNVKDKTIKIKNLIIKSKLLGIKGEYDNAIIAANEGYEIASKQNIKELQKRCLEQMYKLYIINKDYKNGYNSFSEFVKIKDSLNNNELQKLGLMKQFELENELKEIENEKELEKIEALSKEKESKSQLIISFVSLILVLLILFSIFLFSRLKLIRKQRNEIQYKNNEILDSISYAKRIQDAILPPMEYWKTHLPNSFVYYQPKDIVAGDFYWMENKNELVFFAAADCTGHGVPGALVSVVCSNALNRTLLEFGVLEPGKILDKTRELVISTFEKSGKDVKDGMDISLCCYNKLTNELQWAGANNPLWIIQNKKIIEIKGNKQPIGNYSDLTPFTTHKILLQKEDTIYIFTDGFADQFGGEKGKKYKYKQFQDDLIEINSLPIDSQKDVLNQKFISWKNNLEQVDDICIIGIKI